MIISFSGPSGAGKSTIIDQLINSRIFFGEKIFIKEEDSFITIKLAKQILGENIFSRYKEEWYFKKKYNDILYKLFKYLSLILYPLVVYLEFLMVYFWYEIISKKTILIVDKFIYDHEVNFKTLMGINNSFINWLYNHFPRPYLSFLIDINLANASFKRNKHNISGKITANETFHRSVLNLFLKIAKKQSILLIDNNGDLNDTIKNINQHIMNKKKLLSAKRIAICGLDGAGKTTIANMLEKYSEHLHINCKIVHFIHNNLLYKFLLRLGYYKSDESESDFYKRKREHSARERIKKTPFIMAFLRFFDSYVQYFFYITIYSNKLIIFDRFFYDYTVSFEYLNIKNRSFFNSFIPDIRNKFLLSSSPQTYYRRKPERVKAFFKESHEIYLKVAREQDIRIIDTEKMNSDSSLQEILENIN